jgi:CheY-like chemotaxis protein
MFVASVHRLLRSLAQHDLGRPRLTDIMPTKTPSGEQQNRSRRAAGKQPISIKIACQLSPWDVPVIMITAYGDAETKRRALENGAGALLT